MKKLFSRIFVSAALLGLLGVAPLAQAAPPSLKQVETTLNQGDYGRAQQMLAEVVQAYPRDARARYLYAQVLDRNGQPVDGLQQLAHAQQLDPALKFAQPGRFAEVQRKIGADAQRASNSGVTPRADVGSVTSAVTPLAAAGATEHHGAGFGMILLVLVLVAVGALMVWGVRRARRNEENRATVSRREQLRQATDLLNGVRALKLDIRLSTQEGHELFASEAQTLESQLLKVIEGLGDGSRAAANPTDLPAFEQLGSLSRQFESLKARVEGRPDPYPPQPAGSGQFANEADRFSQAREAAPQTVIVQQPGGGMGMGGGLLTGVLLGEMLGGGRDRVVERDVLVDDPRQRPSDPGVDFGQGGNDWNDGGSNFDVGSDDSGGWSDNN